MREEIFRMSCVTQEQSGIQCLHNISLHIFKGEILGLLALDDLGLDELVALMCRNRPIKYGKVYFENKQVNSFTAQESSENKVYVIEKESKLVSGLSIADNMFVLRRKFKKYVIRSKVLYNQAERQLKELGLNISPSTLCQELTGYERCVIELLKSVLQGAQVVVLREISDILGSVDLEKFQKIVKQYTELGISFLYICSHHEELFPFCERLILLEDGYVVKVFDKKEMTEENMRHYVISMNGGRDSSNPKNSDNQSVFSFNEISTDKLRKLSFELKKGECITLLDNNNFILPEIIKLITGEAAPVSGEILFGDRTYSVKDSHQALKQGIAVIQENPIKSMLFYEMTYMENLMFLIDQKIKKNIIPKGIQKSIEKELYETLGDSLYSNNISQLPAEDLYNLIYYRILLYKPSVLICVQPFSGADMYLRNQIVSLMESCKEEGISTVILAVRLSDTMTVSDRLYVIEHGHVKQEYNKEEYLAELEINLQI